MASPKKRVNPLFVALAVVLVAVVVAVGVVFFQLHSKISALQTGASFTFRYEITPKSPDKPPLLNIIERVNASSGSGKSTLAKRLGERYGLPVLHMDTVHFLPGWVERPFAEEEAIVRQFLDENAGGWVIDGNYSKTCYARRLKEADKIIVLWFSPLVCLWRAIRRWQQNKGRVRESSAPGCEEKIDAEFVRWILHDGRTKQKWAKMERIGEKYPEKYVLIRNQRELDGFLKEL